MTEAVNNAIHHGNRLDPDKKTKVEYDRTDSQIRFIVVDEGPGFDFTNLPDPTAPENLEKPNGRGIFLMKNLADEINFEDDGRKVELIFNLN
jgi:serine/threonine-protein kinase RsbW